MAQRAETLELDLILGANQNGNLGRAQLNTSPSVTENGEVCVKSFLNYGSNQSTIVLTGVFVFSVQGAAPCSPNPCQNGGACSVRVVRGVSVGFRCQCAASHRGRRCQSKSRCKLMQGDSNRPCSNEFRNQGSGPYLQLLK